MPVETVPNTTISYHLVAFDANGREVQNDQDGMMSRRAIDAVKDPAVSDVFLISHGWRGDVPAARAQYRRWIGAMAGCADDIKLDEKESPRLPAPADRPALAERALGRRVVLPGRSRLTRQGPTRSRSSSPKPPRKRSTRPRPARPCGRS